jgi:putative NADH-flavin reductase
MKSFKNILLLGIETSFGINLAKYLLSQNYFVTVVVKRKKEIEIHHSNLEIIEGDVLNLNSIRDAFSGQQVVINVIKSNAFNTGVITAISQNILYAIVENKVDKYIGLAPFGSGETSNNLSLVYKMKIYFNLLKGKLKEYSFQEDLLKASNIDYTLVQVGKINNILDKKIIVKVIRPTELSKPIGINDFSVSVNFLSYALLTIMNSNNCKRSTIILTTGKV